MAYLYATTRALSETKGFNSLGQDLCGGLRKRTAVDAQGMVGLSHRAGLGKARCVKSSCSSK